MNNFVLYFLLITACVVITPAQTRISKIPDGLITQIQADIRDCIKYYEGGKKELLKYLTAETTDLNNDKQVEYIVEGEDMGKCISGNKFHSIWVYRKTKSGFEMILESSSTELTILKTSTKGFKDIKEISLDGQDTYTKVYKFNGSKYKPVK